ncbi:aminopeptidase P family protein [bacterium]|nr:aminopeptidase P family protein [bacterium]
MNYSERIEKLRSRFEKLNVSYFLTIFPPHVHYLTGFTGSNGLCLIGRSSVHFLTDGRYIEQSKQQVQNADIRITGIGQNIFDKLSECKFLPDKSHVGFESMHISFQSHADLVSKLPSCRFLPTQNAIETIARIKDRFEIESLRKAIAITEKTFETIIKEIKPGMTELEIAGRIVWLMRQFGGEREAFETIIAAGARSALPHARPTNAKVQTGEVLLFDFGAVYNGYHADMTRTVVVGRASDLQRRIYGTVKSAVEKAIAAAKPGLPTAEVDRVARSIITEQGYGDYFTHSLGHGIGLEIHEAPLLGRTDTTLLEEGNVVTIEPGIYLPDQFGIRIENDVCITSDGCENLMRLPIDLIEI